jgi:hypothetical protein
MTPRKLLARTRPTVRAAAARAIYARLQRPSCALDASSPGSTRSSLPTNDAFTTPHHSHDTTRRWNIATGVSLSAFPPSILVHRMQTAPLSSTKLPISSPREDLIDLLQRIEASRTTRLLVALIISSAQDAPFCFLCATGAGEEERKNTVQALCCGCMDMGKSWLQAEDDSIRRLLFSRRTKSERIRREDGEPRACRVAR